MRGLAVAAVMVNLILLWSELLGKSISSNYPNIEALPVTRLILLKILWGRYTCTSAIGPP